MQFVWGKGFEEEMNVVLAFVWDCKKDLGEGALCVCGAQAFRVWKNGVMIGHGPARAAHGYARKDSYPFERLQKGDRITVEVSAYNIRCLSTVGKAPYFAAEIVADGQTVAETYDFACYHLADRKQKVLRHGFQRAFVESYAMKKCRTALYAGDCLGLRRVKKVSVDAPKLLSRNVPYPVFSETLLSAPMERGKITEKAEVKLWRDRAHEITDIFDGFPLETLDENVSDEVCAMDFEPTRNSRLNEYSKGKYGVYDFTRTLSGFYHLKLTVLSDTVFYLIFDEIDSRVITGGTKGVEVNYRRADCANIVKYALKRGEYELTSFEPYSVRYTRLAVTKGRVRVRSFGFIPYENPSAYAKKFDCLDKELERIVCAAQNTLAQNAVDLLMDCPSRERAGWINDAFFSGRAEYLLTGENHAHYNLLENYALSPENGDLEKGMLPMCYPGDFPNHDFIPNNALWFVLNVYDYRRRNGDDELVARCKEKVYGALAYFKTFENEYELLENLKGWIFLEWSAANWKHFVRGVNFPSNMTYAKALECAGKLYGDGALLEKSERIKRRIRELSFNGEFFTDNAERDENGKLSRTQNTTETCQYYAFFFGVADRETHGKLYRTLIEEFGSLRKKGAYETVYPSNALIGFLLRLELLRWDKDYARLLYEVKKYYLRMAETTGTLWEHKDARASLNHGFASYVGALVAEALGFISGCEKEV